MKYVLDIHEQDEKSRHDRIKVRVLIFKGKPITKCTRYKNKQNINLP